MTKKGYYSAKRRAIMAQGEKINHTEVFDAHNWICHLCGLYISRHANKDDWWRATLDHIVPLSRGGRHVWDNVAPAHWKCNMDKGDRLD